MSLFSKLFGGGEKSEPEPVTYKGFNIIPDLMAEGGKYRLSARIEKNCRRRSQDMCGDPGRCI